MSDSCSSKNSYGDENLQVSEEMSNFYIFNKQCNQGRKIYGEMWNY